MDQVSAHCLSGQRTKETLSSVHSVLGVLGHKGLLVDSSWLMVQLWSEASIDSRGQTRDHT